jgi:hypothetical protein
MKAYGGVDVPAALVPISWIGPRIGLNDLEVRKLLILLGFKL